MYKLAHLSSKKFFKCQLLANILYTDFLIYRKIMIELRNSKHANILYWKRTWEIYIHLLRNIHYIQQPFQSSCDFYINYCLKMKCVFHTYYMNMYTSQTLFLRLIWKDIVFMECGWMNCGRCLNLFFVYTLMMKARENLKRWNIKCKISDLIEDIQYK